MEKVKGGGDKSPRLSVERINELRKEWADCWTPTDEEFEALITMALEAAQRPSLGAPVRMMRVEGTRYDSVIVDAGGRFMPLVEVIDALTAAIRLIENRPTPPSPLAAPNDAALHEAAALLRMLVDAASNDALEDFSRTSNVADAASNWLNKYDVQNPEAWESK